jgi:hypothetical protein
VFDICLFTFNFGSVRASRIRLFQDPSGSTEVPDRGIVELLGPGASAVSSII